MLEGTHSAASGPAAAARPPLGVVAAAARAAPGEDGKGRLAAGRRFEARHSEAGYGRYGEASLGARVVRGGGVVPRSLGRLRGQRRLHSRGSRPAAEVEIHQGESHPGIVGIGAVDGAPGSEGSEGLLRAGVALAGEKIFFSNGGIGL